MTTPTDLETMTHLPRWVRVILKLVSEAKAEASSGPEPQRPEAAIEEGGPP